MSAVDFVDLQEAFMYVFGPALAWLIAIFLAAGLSAAFFELYYEFGNWLSEQASE